MISPLVAAAFFTGLLSSAHCMAMCGSLVGALSLGRGSASRVLGFQILYNSGRLLTYSLLGAAAGSAGSIFALTETLRTPSSLLMIGTDLLVITLGLIAAGFLPGISPRLLEFAVPHALFARALKRIKDLPMALGAFLPGVIFGLLPCGLVYAMLLSATQSGGLIQGALLMAAFALGTLPALLLFSGGAHALSNKSRSLMARGAGILIAAMGLWNLWRHLKMMGVEL